MSARGAIEQADRSAAAQAAPAGDTPLLRLAGRASEVADQPPLIALSVAVAVGGWLLGRPRPVAAGARMLAAELVATGIKDAIKHRVDRTRPEVEQAGGRYRAGPGTARGHAETSFPSGHTAGAVAVAGALGRSYPALRWPAFAAAGLAAAVQVPRGKHYPTDLVAGLAVGLAADALVAGAEALAGRWLAGGGGDA